MTEGISRRIELTYIGDTSISTVELVYNDLIGEVADLSGFENVIGGRFETALFRPGEDVKIYHTSTEREALRQHEHIVLEVRAGRL